MAVGHLIGKYAYDIADVEGFFHDELQPYFPEDQRKALFDLYLNGALEIMPNAIETLQGHLEETIPGQGGDDFLSQLMDLFSTHVWMHLRYVTTVPNPAYRFSRYGNDSILISVHYPVPVNPAPSVSQSLSAAFQESVENGDYYPEKLRHVYQSLNGA